MKHPILFLDNHLVVINKLAGQTTEEATYNARDTLKILLNKPGNVFLEAAHQIDKPVSGILLCAKTSKALARLHAALKERTCSKTYLAFVHPSPSCPTGTCEHWLTHGDHKAHIVPPGTPGAKLAQLNYTTLLKKGTGSLLQVELISGRYHQIRIQLAALGSPILGDIKYGGMPWPQKHAIALHHHKMRLHHPIQREEIEFTAPLPEYFPCDTHST